MKKVEVHSVITDFPQNCLANHPILVDAPTSASSETTILAVNAGFLATLHDKSWALSL